MGPQQQKNRRGAVLVETAFVLPIFLVLILAIMELGTLFFVRHSMLNAARDAVRSYAIGELDSSGTSALAQQRLPPLSVSFTITTSADSDSSLDRWVEIGAPLDEVALNDPLGMFSGDQLRVRVTMRRED